MFSLNDKICIIKQPAGLGDIFYLQKIANHYKNLNYDIYWYVISKYMWLKDYISGINFLDKETNEIYTPLRNDQTFANIHLNNHIINQEDLTYLPLLFAHVFFPDHKVLPAKYHWCGIDSEDWAKHIKYKRFENKENELFYNILNLKDDEEYCLINRNFYMNDKAPIKYSGKLKQIEMNFTDGFTLLDWCKVAENAKEIYMTDSSLSYILHTLKLKADFVNIYVREEKNLIDYDFLETDKIKLMQLN